MGWVKLDDGFANHPKVVGLSLEARWAYVEALCYAARYRTDGIVPDVVAANGLIRQELLSCGLWENGPASAITIHDYLAYNMSRGEYDDKAIAGAIGAATRWGDSTSHSRPVPSTSSPVQSRPKPEDTPSFDEFWAAYPRKVGKPKARSAYKRALRRASAEDVILGAKRYAEDPNRSDEFTAHPTTWLNRDGWEDAPLPAQGRREFAEHPLDSMARRHLEEVSRADQQASRGSGVAPARELPGGSD